MYWSDTSSRTVYRVDKWVGGEGEVVVDEIADVMGIKAVDKALSVGEWVDG